MTYDRIMDSVPEVHRSEVWRALLWVAFSDEDMSLIEVAEGVTVNTAEQFFRTEDRFFDASNLLEICGNFLTLRTRKFSHECPEGVFNEHEDNHLRLTHSSVKEYIQSKLDDKSWLSSPDMTSMDPAEFMTETCLIYLLALNETFLCIEDLLDIYPFAQFVANCWYRFYKKIPQGQEKRARTLRISLFEYECNRQPYSNWVKIFKNAWSMTEVMRILDEEDLL